jgi:uncharacterized membrane protein affecting hemolysin expression
MRKIPGDLLVLAILVAAIWGVIALKQHHAATQGHQAKQIANGKQTHP